MSIFITPSAPHTSSLSPCSASAYTSLSPSALLVQVVPSNEWSSVPVTAHRVMSLAWSRCSTLPPGTWESSSQGPGALVSGSGASTSVAAWSRPCDMAIQELYTGEMQSVLPGGRSVSHATATRPASFVSLLNSSISGRFAAS